MYRHHVRVPVRTETSPHKKNDSTTHLRGRRWNNTTSTWSFLRTGTQILLVLVWQITDFKWQEEKKHTVCLIRFNYWPVIVRSSGVTTIRLQSHTQTHTVCWSHMHGLCSAISVVTPPQLYAKRHLWLFKFEPPGLTCRIICIKNDPEQSGRLVLRYPYRNEPYPTLMVTRREETRSERGHLFLETMFGFLLNSNEGRWSINYWNNCM